MTSTSGTTYICIKQFNARLGDELSLKVGDKVEVLADDSEYNDGWYMGKNLLTSEVGLYPKSFTQILQQHNQDGSLLRSRSRRIISNNSTGSNTPVNTSTPNGSKVTDKFSKLNLNGDSESSPTTKVNKTMSDIDRALQELQTESFLGNLSGSNKNKSVNENKEVNGHKDDNDNSNDDDYTTLHLSSKQIDGTEGDKVGSHQRTTSVQSITEDLNPLKAAEWTSQQVSSYFAIVLGFDMDIAGKFARHKITGAILFQLDLAHLKELDIESFGTRFEVHKEIDKLRQISSRNARHKSISRSVSKNNLSGRDTSDNANKSSTLREVSMADDEFISPPGSDTTSPNNYRSYSETADEILGNDTSKRQSRQSAFLMPSANLKPSGSFYKSHQRKRSQSLDNVNEKDNSYLSPKKSGGDFNGSSPADKSFGFNDSSESGLYASRSNAGLGLTTAPSRPSSSIYESSMISHNRNTSQFSGQNLHHRSPSAGTHRRHSSMFSFLSGNDDKQTPKGKAGTSQSHNDKSKDTTNNHPENVTSPEAAEVPKLISPAKVKRNNSLFSPKQRKSQGNGDDHIDIDNASFSPKKSKSISHKPDDKNKVEFEEKRSASDSTGTQGPGAVSRLKNLRTTSTQNFKNLTTSKKSKTSAFQEGIRDVTPDEAIKTANYSGFMSKRSGNTLSWRSRYFTLHGTRLSYFTSLKDKKEKGLIDITAHKVIPVHAESEHNTGSNDKYIALYAASTGFGRYCFKIIPPAPGFKKGLTFTQPKTHYFAVDTQEEMRGWLKALMTATIDIDDSVPVVSSCSTPTVSLAKAQELLSKAREETRLKDEELRAKGYIRDGFESDYGSYLNELSTDLQTSLDSTTSPNIDSVDETTVSSVPQNANGQPKLSIDTSGSLSKTTTKTPSTPQAMTSASNQGGFASPYLLASGLLSPRSGHSATASSPSGTPISNSKISDYFHENTTPVAHSTSSTATPTAPSSKADNEGASTPKSVFSYGNGKLAGGRKKSISNDKMLAYTSDGSGNHTFVIKPKK